MSSALIIADVTLAVATMAFAVGLANSITESRDGGTIGADHFLSAEFRIPNIEPAVGVVAPDSAVVRGRVGETQQALVRRLKAAPEVRGVAVGSVLPGMDHRSRRIELDGETSPDAFEGHQVKMARVDIDFFDALEQPILNGRGFNPADLGENRSAIIVNTSFVDDLLGGQNALGRRVRYTTQPDSTPGPWYQIVGVVGSLGMGGTGEIGNPGLYHALVPGEANPVFLALHLGENPASFTPQLRALASEVDPIALVSDPKALSEVFSFDKLVTDWIVLGAQILVGILLALSISGIYALMSFTVTDRTREIGIRSALGSTRGGIVLNIAKRALVQLGVGVVLGTTIAVFLLSQLKQLGGIPTHSPFALSLAIGVGVTALIGALACTAPTLRALKIMPTEALRSG
jgi:putative ABC transport system permease protein